MGYTIEGISEHGTKTQQNQDACFAGATNTALGEAVFVVLCDGMGGTDAGELASATIVEEFQKWFYCKCDMGEQWVPDTYEVHMEWTDLLNYCNERILEYGREHGIKLGSTVALGLIAPNNVLVMNVGDSRVYEVGGYIKRLNKDHSVVGNEIEQGILTEEEAKLDKRNNQLTQCIGMLDEIEPFFGNYMTIAGTYLFCSDGFYNKNLNSEMQEEINRSYVGLRDLRVSLELLKDNARAKGEKDDITAIAVQIPSM